jgi:L-lactate dehydrogenase complex protein LldE
MAMSSDRPSEVYFLATCLTDLLYPRAGLAGMELIRRAGVRVIYPKRQSCCGQPAYNSGYRDEALKVARHQLSCFPRNIPVVVPSGSCAGMVSHHWPELFAGKPDEAEAVNMAGRTFELTQFLVDHLDLQLEDLGEPTEIVVHTSCSSRNELGIEERIESLLAQLSNVTVREQARKAECCGFGGTFSIKQPDISGAMVQDKCDALEQTGATRVVSQDCGCLMNIGGALEKQGRTLQPQHIAEFLLERTNVSN